eukprot:GGOE01021368.1.p1 GENE.GGOE01021368.1~~GGOE01021368.1.p1  ORF type:complete len:433 (-),score=131.48 GGOE01021368.1:329-1627(-)
MMCGPLMEKRKLQREKEELELEKALLEQELAAQAWQQERQEQRRREQERQEQRREQEQREYEAREAARREKADRMRRDAELGRHRHNQGISQPHVRSQRRTEEFERRVERPRGSRGREEPRGWHGDRREAPHHDQRPVRESYLADRHRSGNVAGSTVDRQRQPDFRSGKGKGKGGNARRFAPPGQSTWAEDAVGERGARRSGTQWQAPPDVGRAPPEKPCKELVKRMAMCLKNKVKAVIEVDGAASGPEVTLEALREKMNLCLPLEELKTMLESSLNEELVMQVGDFLYCNLDAEKRAREAEAVIVEERPEKRQRLEEEVEKHGGDPEPEMVEDAQELEHEHEDEPAEQQAEEKHEELMRKDLRDKQARMEALARQLEQRRAEEEELARLQQEVEALRGHLGEEDEGERQTSSVTHEEDHLEIATAEFAADD